MSDFQEGFFRDLWYDVLLNGSGSILYRYFREEKTQHSLVRQKKYDYERAAVYGPPCSSPNIMEDAGVGQTGKRQNGGQKGHSRRGASEHACVEMLCRYYEFLTDYAAFSRDGDSDGASRAADGFLDELYQKTDEAKVSQKRKKPIFRTIAAAKQQLEDERMEGILEQVMDLYLYAESAQFLYNAGYPLPQEEEREPGEGDRPEPKRKKQARIKTIPLRLLDYYFADRGVSFDDVSSISRMSPSWIANHEDLKEKMEEVYEFVCDNGMTRAVIPLLLDHASGIGLYIIGKTYLQGWNSSMEDRQKVEDILGDRPCCYAIVKFLNLELNEDDQYFWSPYSIVDMVYGTCDTNPEGILFHDLDMALNIYKGQLNVASQDILYENFRNENVVYMDERDVTLDPEYRKYFRIEEKDGEDISGEIDRYKQEYEERMALELGEKTGYRKFYGD